MSEREFSADESWLLIYCHNHCIECNHTSALNLAKDHTQRPDQNHAVNRLVEHLTKDRFRAALSQLEAWELIGTTHTSNGVSFWITANGRQAARELLSPDLIAPTLTWFRRTKLGAGLFIGFTTAGLIGGFLNFVMEVWGWISGLFQGASP